MHEDHSALCMVYSQGSAWARSLPVPPRPGPSSAAPLSMEIKAQPFPVSLHSLSSTLPPELLPRVQKSENSSAANAYECGEEQPL